MSLSTLRSTCRKIRVELLLFLIVFFSFSYFYNGAADNHNSRLNLIFAFVEPDSPDYLSFTINRFITDPARGVNTIDWAWHDGNYYSNKAPGPALLGIPWYFVLYHSEKALGIDPVADVAALVNAYLIHLFVTVLPIAVSSMFFYRTVRQLVSGQSIDVFLTTIALYWGTLVFPYSTQLWGHVTAAAFVVIAAYFLLLNPTTRSAYLCGFCIGMAVLSEYSCVICTCAFGAALLCDSRPRFGWYLLGGLVPLIAFAVYHKICFDSYITAANFHNNPVFLDDRKLAHILGGPTISAFWGITFSTYRGLFFFMPVLLLVFPALTRLAIPDRRVLALAGGGSVLGFILMNISFNGWHGGACVGPRYQIPVLSLYILILTGIAGQRYYRPLLVLLLIPSFLNMLAIAMISPMAPESVMNPMEKYYTGIIMMFGGGPDFIHPFDFPIRLQSRAEPVVADWSTFNWGEVIGLEGVSTVIPWLVLMVVGSGICCSWSMSAEKR